MRRCGPQFKTRTAALDSDEAQAGGWVPRVKCRCGAFHVRTTPGRKTAKTPRVRASAARTGARRIPARVCRLVDKRDSIDGQRCCIRCGITRGLHRHHRRIKGTGGDLRPHTDCPCNLVTLCHRCHGWAHVEDQRAAEVEGLIIARAETFPGRLPVMVHTEGGGLTMHPTCDGRWDEAVAAEGIAA